MKKKYLISIISITLNLFQASYAKNFLTYFNAAQHNDNTLLNQYAQYHAAIDNVDIARAGLLPSINFTGNYNLSSHSHGFTSYGLSLSQTLLNIPSWSGYNGAKLSEKAEYYQTLSAWQDLCERYVEAYLAQAQAQVTLRLDQQSQRITRNLYRLTQRKFKAGQVKSTDVSTVYTSLLSSQSTILTDHQTLATKQNNLEIITHSPILKADELISNLPLISPKSKQLQQWQKKALSMNPALKAAHFTSLASKQNILSAEAGHIPTLSLTANYNGDDTATTSHTSAGISLSLPLFSGFKTTAQTRQAQQNYIAQYQTEKLAIQKLMAQTKTAYQHLFYDIKLIQSSRKTLRAAKRAYQNNLITYKSGLLDITSLLNAKQSVYQQQLSLIEKKYNYVLQIILLRQSIGALGKPDIVNLSYWLK